MSVKAIHKRGQQGTLSPLFPSSPLCKDAEREDVPTFWTLGTHGKCDHARPLEPLSVTTQSLLGDDGDDGDAEQLPHLGGTPRGR